LAQPGILGVTASTFNDNIASHRILKKNGFVIFNRVNNLTWWVKQKQLQE
jgi:RimJ/RimL family protein N-acetyltransferase